VNSPDIILLSVWSPLTYNSLQSAATLSPYYTNNISPSTTSLELTKFLTPSLNTNAPSLDTSFSISCVPLSVEYSNTNPMKAFIITTRLIAVPSILIKY
jgi:hypothetical protein